MLRSTTPNQARYPTRTTNVHYYSDPKANPISPRSQPQFSPQFMQFGVPRQPSVLPQSNDRDSFYSHHDTGPSNSVSPLPYISTPLSHRRRSSALRPPPHGPPPSQPIPSVPMIDTTTITASDGFSVTDDESIFSPIAVVQNHARPAASSRLVAVAAFPQAQARHTPPTIAATPSTNGTHSPPRQRTHSPPSWHQDIVSDRVIHSPRDSQSPAERSRPSSRRALTKALELAREAVRLDSTNDDPYGAVVAYGKSVSLLSKVMERVMSGEETGDSVRRRGGRRRSVVAQEEEVRRLKAIVRFTRRLLLLFSDHMNVCCSMTRMQTG